MYVSLSKRKVFATPFLMRVIAVGFVWRENVELRKERMER